MTTRPSRANVLRLLPGVLGLFLALALAAAEPAAAVRYLDPAGSDGNGANLCLDPATPCATPAHAIRQSAAGDTLRFAPGSYAAARLVLPHALTLRGDGAAVVTLDGRSVGTVLTLSPGVAATIEGLTIRNGAGLRGGAARVEAGGALVLRGVALEDNRADQGGAVYAANSRLTIEDSRLANNTAGTGGALYLDGGSLALARSTLDGNRAGSGAGLFAGPLAAVALDRATLSGNVANTVGGGIHSFGTLTVANSLLRDNSAGAHGGGLFNDGGTADVDYATFLNNSAAKGAAVAGSGVIRLRASVLVGVDLCDGPLAGSGNLANDDSCGQPAQPATGLLADGRPAYGSNAIDAGPSGACATAGGATSVDRRGLPRPADGNRDGNVRCDPGAFEFQPSLTILLNPTEADGTRFDFAGDFGPLTLWANDRPRHIFEAAPGAHGLQQIVEPGWKLHGLACDGDADGGSLVDLAARAATVDLDPGESIVCVFTNRPNRDTIGVIVRAPAGTDPTVAFSGALGDFELRPTTELDRRSGRLPAGTHAVVATPPDGWRVAAIECAGDRDGDTNVDLAAATALVDLDSKEAIGCVFTLAPSGAALLTIRHETAPAADAPFIYTGDLGLFALRAVSAGSRVFTPPPGVYRVHELLHPQWALSRLECAGDADGGSLIAPEEATAAIDLDAGEAITCVFSHARTTSGTGAITIIAAAEPPGGVAFPFAGSLGEFALTPPNAPARTFAQLRPGSYPVRQVTPAGWALNGITCAGDADNGTTLLPDEAMALIDLDEGEAITCTYSSSPPAGTGAVTIIHEAIPADGMVFRYNGDLGGFNLRAPTRPSRSFVELAPGAYTVGYRAVDGWTLEGISCEGDSDGDSAANPTTRTMALDLDAGEAIVCRFHHLGPGVTPSPSPTPAPTPSPTPPPKAGDNRVLLPFVRR